jgi:hypothetical protein
VADSALIDAEPAASRTCGPERRRPRVTIAQFAPAASTAPSAWYATGLCSAADPRAACWVLAAVARTGQVRQICSRLRPACAGGHTMSPVKAVPPDQRRLRSACLTRAVAVTDWDEGGGGDRLGSGAGA